MSVGEPYTPSLHVIPETRETNRLRDENERLRKRVEELEARLLEAEAYPEIEDEVQEMGDLEQHRYDMPPDPTVPAQTNFGEIVNRALADTFLGPDVDNILRRHRATPTPTPSPKPSP